MREFRKSCGRLLGTGWFWPLVLLALPGCFLNAGAYDPPDEIFKPGEAPLTGLIMCDIPKVTAGDDCATDDDILNLIGMPSTNAAVALNTGLTAETVLDYSDAALLACGGKPRKTQFFGTYPNGLEVCLNCDTQISEVYADANEACVAKCQDLVAQGEIEPPGSALEFCQARAHVSVNFNPKQCFEGFCTNGGMPAGLADPRLDPEALKWTDFQGTTPEDNGLTLQFAGPGNGSYSAGAASDQLITGGDAWVEFEAGETGMSHLVGVRTSCSPISACPDTDGTADDIPLGLNLHVTGDVYITANGTTTVVGPLTPPYVAGEKFRINITDNHDGTASLSFSRLASSCTPGLPCAATVLYPAPLEPAPTAAYPLRVDASFREGPATLKNATIMRIKQ